MPVTRVARGVVAALLWLLAASAVTAQPGALGPQGRSYYYQGAPSPVRLYDGGTNARDPLTARRNLGAACSNCTETIYSNWTFLGSLGLPYTNATDSTFFIVNASDTTKKAKFSSQLITTGTTNRYMLPATSGTLALAGAAVPSGTSIYDPLLSVKDSQFFVKNETDTTKQWKMTLANQTTATTVVDSLPLTSQMLAGVGSANVFRNKQQIVPGTDVVPLTINDPGGTNASNFIEAYSSGTLYAFMDNNGAFHAPVMAIQTAGGSFTLAIQNKSAIGTNRTYSIDNTIASTDFAMTGGTQTIGGAKTISGASFFTGAGGANVGGATKFVFRDAAATTKILALDASQLTAGATKIDTIPDVSGWTMMRTNKRDMTGLTANVAATNLATTPTAGMYRVSVYGVVSGILGSAVTVTLGWTDPVQAQTAATTFGLGVGSVIIVTQLAQVASGSITITTSGYLSGTYALYCRVELIP